MMMHGLANPKNVHMYEGFMMDRFEGNHKFVYRDGVKTQKLKISQDIR
jgi:hypothetical protein